MHDVLRPAASTETTGCSTAAGTVRARLTGPFLWQPGGHHELRHAPSTGCCLNRIRLARLLHQARDDYDAFLIVHGTDTLAYTASALSLLLAGFRKPIVLTGQQPTTSSRMLADAWLNRSLSRQATHK